MARWKLVCQRCGRYMYSDEARHEWTGLIVCPEDYDTRHEQEFVRGRRDVQRVPFARLPSEARFLGKTGQPMGLLLALTYHRSPYG